MKLFIDTAPLRHAAYRRLWIGQVVSFTGAQVTAVAVPVQVYAMTRSSFWVGVLGVAGFVPLLVFGLWGGAIADHFDRRRVLLISSLVSWAVTLLLLLQALLGLDSLALLIVCVVVQSGAFAMASPSRNAIIPRLLPDEDIAPAMALGSTGMHSSILLGPLLAAAALTADRYWIAYLIDAVLFTVVLWAALRLPAVPPLTTADAKISGWRSVKDGLRYMSSQPVLLMSFVVDIIAMTVAMPRALFPEVADTHFGGSSATGLLVAALGLGGLAGGLVSGWIGRVDRQGAALILMVAVFGAAVAAAGLTRSLWPCVLLLGVAGAADMISGVFRQAILATYAPDEMRGRLQGVFVVVVAGGPRIGDLRAGAMAASLGASASWILGGIGCVVLVVAAGLAFPALLRYRVSASDTGKRSLEQVT
ncbi:MFS transporter [Actinocorallia longicatena]|uniref:MFS transporter n=1 Tax=Actinocorallia longicatena TaxID=111803 RepID=A0ABP6Q890_9ACTN